MRLHYLADMKTMAEILIYKHYQRSRMTRDYGRSTSTATVLARKARNEKTHGAAVERTRRKRRRVRSRVPDAGESDGGAVGTENGRRKL